MNLFTERNICVLVVGLVGASPGSPSDLESGPTGIIGYNGYMPRGDHLA